MKEIPKGQGWVHYLQAAEGDLKLALKCLIMALAILGASLIFIVALLLFIKWLFPGL